MEAIPINRKDSDFSGDFVLALAAIVEFSGLQDEHLLRHYQCAEKETLSFGQKAELMCFRGM